MFSSYNSLLSNLLCVVKQCIKPTDCSNFANIQKDSTLVHFVKYKQTPNGKYFDSIL